MREAGRFDRRAGSVRAGLLAAIPVVAVLALGTVAWSAVARVTMGAGAMLVGIAWRVRGGRPPLAVLATDGLLDELDEIVDAANSLASLTQLDGSSPSNAGSSPAEGASVLDN